VIFQCAMFVDWMIHRATRYEVILKLFLSDQYLIELVKKKGLKKKRAILQ